MEGHPAYVRDKQAMNHATGTLIGMVRNTQ